MKPRSVPKLARRPHKETRVHPTILALRDLLVTVTARTVEVVSLPANRMANDVVYVWPWRVDEDRSVRRIPIEPQDASMLPNLRVSCLAFASDVETLELVRTAVFQNPVLGSGPQRIMIHSDPMDAALLLNLFLAAKVQPRPCLNYVLQASAASSPSFDTDAQT